MKKTILSLFVSMASLLCFAQNEIENLYHGKIANKYAITMNLIFKGNKVSGTYQYDKYAKDIEKQALVDLEINGYIPSGDYNPYIVLKQIYDNLGEYNKFIELLNKLKQAVPNDPSVDRLIDQYKKLF